jgi:hypothetical protein
MDCSGLGFLTARNKEFIQNVDMKTTLKIVAWKTRKEYEDSIEVDTGEIAYDGTLLKPAQKNVQRSFAITGVECFKFCNQSYT